jgi:pSer/pThr/pTyr-binding forkhead associated (FHA) protein
MAAPDPVSFLFDPTGQEHPLSGDSTTIGRAIENSIVITSKRVSREHARIRREGRRVFLEDVGSTNGTFLNDERIFGPVELRDGDRIGVGEVTFVFHDPDTTTRENPLPELEVNVAAGIVRVDRRAIELSPKEFEIGRAVWMEYKEGVYDYQIENLVRRLRTKVEIDPADPQLLVTVRGLGYKLV